MILNLGYLVMLNLFNFMHFTFVFCFCFFLVVQVQDNDFLFLYLTMLIFSFGFTQKQVHHRLYCLAVLMFAVVLLHEFDCADDYRKIYLKL